jgi:hypothetical protein
MGGALVLKGVIHGKTITLEEGTFLPDGCQGVVHLTLDREVAMRLLAEPGPEMTEEELADLEEELSESRGRPVKLPRAGQQ